MLSLKKKPNSAIKQPLTIQSDPRKRKKSTNVRSVAEISLQMRIQVSQIQHCHHVTSS